RGRLPGHRQRVQAELEAGHDLPGAVLAAAHRHDAVVTLAARAGVSGHLLELPAPRPPVDRLLQLVGAAGIADALRVQGDVRSRLWGDAAAAIPQPPNSSRNIFALRK